VGHCVLALVASFAGNENVGGFETGGRDGV